MPVRVCFRVTSKLAPFLYAPPVMGLYISACYPRGAAGPDHFCLAHTVRVPVCSDHRIIRNACFGALSLDLSAWPVMAFALVGIFSVQDNQSGFSTSTLPWRASCSSLEGSKVLLNLWSDPLPCESFLGEGDTRPRLEIPVDHSGHDFLCDDGIDVVQLDGHAVPLRTAARGYPRCAASCSYSAEAVSTVCLSGLSVAFSSTSNTEGAWLRSGKG